MTTDRLREFGMSGGIVATLLLVSANASAREVTASIHYLAGETVYIDCGRRQGLAVGDTAIVHHEGSTVAQLVVEYISQETASCRILNSSGAYHPGDTVTVRVKEKTGTEESLPEKAQSEESVESALPEAHQETSLEETPDEGPPTNQASGRVAIEFSTQIDRDDPSDDYEQPSLSTSMRIENIVGSGLILTLRGRIRRTASHRETGSGIGDRWANRIYEVSLESSPGLTNWYYQVGRIYADALSGIGALDGAMIVYKTTTKSSVGIFAGTRPEFGISEPRFRDPQGGLFARYVSGSWQTRRVDLAVALAGRYRNGEIDREFIYQQLFIALGRALSLSQNTQIDIHRGWRRIEAGSRASVSRMAANLRFAPSRSVSMNLGYNNQVQQRTYETKDTPDSLFDAALRQGLHMTVTASPARRIRVTATAGLRIRNVDDTDNRSASAGIVLQNLLGSGIGVSSRFAAFENRYSSGTQPSISLYRRLGQRTRLSFSWGRNSYDLLSTSGTTSEQWVAVSTDIALSRSISASLTGDYRTGSSIDVLRSHVGIRYRF